MMFLCHFFVGEFPLSFGCKRKREKENNVASEAKPMHQQLAELKSADSPALSEERCGFKHMRFSALCSLDA